MHTTHKRDSRGRSAYYALQRSRGIAIESDLRAYRDIAAEVARCAVPDDLASAFAATGSGGRSAELPTAYDFALIAEACRRGVELDPFEEQIIAGYAMARGKLAQMQTGEGKTLAAVFAATFHARGGAGVHVITANDYLARRDAEWMRPAYELLGLTVASIDQRTPPDERRRAYACDVTYVTAQQAGFDYLRDGLQYEAGALVQRELAVAIVDEADFILIDEARVPLVIGTAVNDAPSVDPLRADEIARSLTTDEYVVDRAGRNCGLTTQGWQRVSNDLGCEEMDEGDRENAIASVHVALHAHHLLSRDVDYIVRNGKVELVDEGTGRVAERREWPYGIQRAIEAKERVAFERTGTILATITIQDYVHLYGTLAAMTATAVPAAAEFSRQHGLAVVVIPPHREQRCVHAPDRVFTTREAKLTAVVETIGEANATGRPVLAGTRSVRASQELAERLARAGIACKVLNAANDEAEAQLIAAAGGFGAVTVATNMAGRGTDIRLGGPDGRDAGRVAGLGGLLVIGTERHESVRVDDQLRGRAGRQGDPGGTQFFVSLEDELVTRYAITDLVPAEYRDAREGAELRDPRVAREIARAQEIIEAQHDAMRRTLRSYSRIVESERRVVRELRMAAIVDEELPVDLLSRAGAAVESVDPATLVRLFLIGLDELWADHLALVDEIREGIHLQRLGQRNPLLVAIQQISGAFDAALDETYDRVAAQCAAAAAGYDVTADDGALDPASTWTYLINDDPFPAFRIGLAGPGDPVGALVAALGAIVRLFVAPFVALERLLARAVKRGGVSRPGRRGPSRARRRRAD